VLKRTLFLGALVVAFGYGALVFLQWQMGLGEFAKGPQQLTFLRYDRKVVAGGRAGVEYFGRESGELSFLLHCLEKGETVNHPLRLQLEQRSRETCGVYLRPLAVKGSDAFTVEVEISWDNK
jgi:hypothetical protein